MPKTPQGPFHDPHKRLAPAVGKGIQAAPRPTDTAVPQIALEEDQCPPPNRVNVLKSVFWCSQSVVRTIERLTNT